MMKIVYSAKMYLLRRCSPFEILLCLAPLALKGWHLCEWQDPEPAVCQVLFDDLLASIGADEVSCNGSMRCSAPSILPASWAGDHINRNCTCGTLMVIRLSTQQESDYGIGMKSLPQYCLL